MPSQKKTGTQRGLLPRLPLRPDLFAFLLIGLKTDFELLITYVPFIVVAFLAIVVARILSVYPIIGITKLMGEKPDTATARNVKDDPACWPLLTRMGRSFGSAPRLTRTFWTLRPEWPRLSQRLNISISSSMQFGQISSLYSARSRFWHQLHRFGCDTRPASVVLRAAGLCL